MFQKRNFVDGKKRPPGPENFDSLLQLSIEVDPNPLFEF